MNEEQEQSLTKKEAYDLRKQERERTLVKSGKERSFLRIGLWTGAILVLGFAAAGLATLGGGGDTQETAFMLGAISPADRVKGDVSARVVLIEYSDFQCPACAAYYPLVKKLNEDFSGKIAFVYRHFPLPQHRNAKPAAYAAEAAGAQGKFWELHDLIFEGQREWAEARNADEIFERYATSLHLDLAQFRIARDAAETKARVEEDLNGGLRAGVNATPTFFLNGTKIQPTSYDEFRAAIEAALAGVR